MNSTTFRTDEARWAACLARDTRADGAFCFGVLTTGIYCRPSCAARRPHREHVRFYLDAAQARRAGLRACRRCRPDGAGLADQHAALILRACLHLQDTAQTPDLRTLAREAHLSPSHFQRLFKRATGLSPAAFRSAQRAARMREVLPQAASVTEALYEAGYGSSGRFYELGARALGMRPSLYRRGGEGLTISYAVRRCWLGALLIALTERGVCAVLLGEGAAALYTQLQERFPRARLQPAARGLAARCARIVAHVQQPELPLRLPLDLQGTAFQHRVWHALQGVPVGRTTHYAALAAAIGQPRAVRAVARAVAANPVAVLVPCHRVIGRDGTLRGYRWGLQRKRRLLEREQRSRRD